MEKHETTVGDEWIKNKKRKLAREIFDVIMRVTDEMSCVNNISKPIYIEVGKLVDLVLGMSIVIEK